MGDIKIGIALGGGGARGIAHIGVLKVLHSEGIRFAHICGTSIGAVVGALYSLHGNPSAILDRTLEIIESKLFAEASEEFLRGKRNEKAKLFDRLISYAKQIHMYNLSRKRLSLIKEETIKKVIAMAIPDISVRDLHIPYTAVATDLVHGRSVTLEHLSLRKAIQASIAIPGIFPPVVHNDMVLVDGGVLENVPVLTSRSANVDIVIGVDVGFALRRISQYTGALQVMFRSSFLSNYYLSKVILTKADIIVRPMVANLHWTSFKRYKWLIEQGEKEASKILPQLRQCIKNKKSRNFWKKILRRD